MRNQIEITEKLLKSLKSNNETKTNSESEIIKENKYLKSVITDLKKSITNNSESEITNKVKENDLTKKFEDAKNTILSYFK